MATSEESDYRTVRSSLEYNFCPLCGRETTREEYAVGSIEVDGEMKTTKTNMRVTCPEHGTLVHG